MTAPSDTATPNARRNLALANAELADGALTLVPPAGFCVDKSTLRPSFAVVARCDSLGARQTVNDAPLGMIVVSVARPTTSRNRVRGRGRVWQRLPCLAPWRPLLSNETPANADVAGFPCPAFPPDVQ